MGMHYKTWLREYNRGIKTQTHLVFTNGNGVPVPNSFRSPRGIKRKAIRGGRWKIRRLNTGDKPWRAWTYSTVRDGQPRSKAFATHVEALEWAQARARQRALTLGSQSGRIDS